MSLKVIFLCLTSLILISLPIIGCGDEQSDTRPARTSSRTQALGISTNDSGSTIRQTAAGIELDPGLESATGTPSPEEMKILIALQKKVPYPVIVPTHLPGGCKLDNDVAAGGQTSGDPLGFYSFRYSNPDNTSRTLTFNQSFSNNRPMPGYYLTEVTINSVDYHVYWHQTKDYVSGSDAVRTTSVGSKAETFTVIWKNDFKDTSGQTHDLYYSLTTGTWSGWGWGDIRNILLGLNALSDVG